jgi:hypothetical protein
MRRVLHKIYDCIGAIDAPFAVANTGEATTVPHVDGWKSALTATSEAQVTRLDFNGGLFLNVDEIKTVRWRVKFGAMPSGSNYRFGLATANASAADDITARLLFELKGSHAITVRSDDGSTDSGSLVTPWTAASGETWEFVADLASGIQPAIPNYLTKTGKKAILIMAGKLGGSLQPFSSMSVSLAALTGGLQLFSRLDKASGTGVGDATMRMIDLEMER